MSSSQIVRKRKLDNKEVNDVSPLAKSSKIFIDINKMKNRTKNDIIKCYEELSEKFETLQKAYDKLLNAKKECDEALTVLEKRNNQLEKDLKVKENQCLVQNTSCEECGYPCESITNLGEHMYEFHIGDDWEETFSCKYCEMKFRTKQELMVHRKRNHAEKVNACKYYAKGTCHFEDRCWFKHEKDQNSSVNLKCGYCGKILTTKNDLMKHLKKCHIEKVQKCKNFMAGNYCNYEDDCWFRHEDENND